MHATASLDYEADKVALILTQASQVLHWSFGMITEFKVQQCINMRAIQRRPYSARCIEELAPPTNGVSENS